MQNLGIVALLQGDVKTGKTRFIAYHTQGRPDDSRSPYEPTVEDEYSVAESVRGQKLTVTFLDTGGHKDCEALLPEWVARAQAQILFLNLEDPCSVDYLRTHVAIFGAAKSRILGGVVVGNLPSGNEANRKVSKQEALNLAASFSWGEFSYMEMSTRTGEGVEAVVATLMESVGRGLPSGAEKVATVGEVKGELSRPPSLVKELSQDVKVWAHGLGMSREAAEVVLELSWPELEAIFASDVPTVKAELAQYGLTKASDRNKLIAGWRTRQIKSKQNKMDRIQRLESRLTEQEQQLKAASTRIEALENQLSDASWTHRIQELFLKQLQSIGWAKKDPAEVATPLRAAAEETTPVKSKAVCFHLKKHLGFLVRGGRKPSMPERGRGPLFPSPSSPLK